MTPERRASLIGWGKTAIMVVAFGGMAVAIDRLVRTYSYRQIADALSSIPVWVVLASIGILCVQHALLIVREWLAVGYAGRREVGPGRTALASVVSRSLSTLGVASITGVGLRLRLYGGWGLGTADVARITAYNELVYLVGLAAQVAFAFGLLPVPATLAGWVPVLAVRAIAGAAALALVVYVIWCARGPREIRIRSLVIPVPTRAQLAGTIVLPVAELVLGAAIVHLCLPPGLALDYHDVIVVCLLGSVAGSLTQIPAGLGVLEGFVLLFARDPAMGSAVIGGLLVRRIITNLLPVVVGAVLLAAVELRRRAGEPRPEWLAEAMATVLATLTFVVGVIVMVLSASPLGDRYGDLGQAVALAAGTGILFVSRGLVRRSARAWQITLGLVMARALVGVVVPPPLLVAAILLILGALLALSRAVFRERSGVVDESPRWWIAFGLAMAGAAWNAFVLAGRSVTVDVLVQGGIMVGVAAVVAATVIVRLLHARRARRRAG